MRFRLLANRSRLPASKAVKGNLSRVARGGGLVSGPHQPLHPLRPVSAQALVEFMLVSIPLLATMFGIFEFGIAFWDLQQEGQVVRDAARQVANCANQCESSAPSESNSPDTKIYKDMYALQAVVDKNPFQRNGTRLNLNNLTYVLIRRVASSDADSLDQFKLNTPYGQYDISGQYQLYVPYAASAGTYLPFEDYQTVDPLLWKSVPSVGAGSPPNTTKNTSYLSTPCIGARPTGTPSDVYYADDKNQAAAATGMDFQCKYSNTGNAVNDNNPLHTWNNGRPVCQPADRFYVEIQYRHNWVTPFLPTIGNSLTKPTNDNGYLVMTQRAYAKVEPRYFPVGNSVCPTGVS